MAKKKIKNLKTSSLSRSLSLARLGLQVGAKAAGQAMSGIFDGEAAKVIRKKALQVEQMALLARELGQLKGSLMKAGQMLSLYGEHFLPPEVNRLLKPLQSDSPAIEWVQMRKVLVRELGKEKMAELEIEEEASAAASLGQVHGARLRATGEHLALKIQYPGVDKAIDGDIKNLKRILTLTEWLPKIPATEGIFAEVKMMLKHELDYERERKNLEFFCAALEGDQRYVLPRPLPRYSTDRLLTMTYERGVTVDSQEVAELSQARRNALSAAALELYFRELFVWRRMQTDPHFGNYRVRIGKDNDQLVLFDYGAVREVPKIFLDKYREMLRGLFYHDRSAFEKAAYNLGVLMPNDPEELRDLFYQLCSSIVEPFAEDAPYDWAKTDLPKRVSKLTWDLIRRFPLRSPPQEMIFLDRKMGGMFTFLAVLGAKINARRLLLPYMEASS